MRFVAFLVALWSIGFGIASCAMFRAAARRNAEADYLGGPLTGPKRDSSIRIEGQLPATPVITSPNGKQSCVAARLEITHEVRRLDRDNPDQDRNQRFVAHIATKYFGPNELPIHVGTDEVRLPLDRWARERLVWEATWQPVLVADPAWNLTTEELARVKEHAGDYSDHNFVVTEWVLPPSAVVFIAARLSKDGELEPDPKLRRIEIYPGDQRAFLAKLRKTRSSLRIGGWVFLAVSLLPLAIVTAIRFRRVHHIEKNRPSLLP